MTRTDKLVLTGCTVPIVLLLIVAFAIYCVQQRGRAKEQALTQRADAACTTITTSTSDAERVAAFDTLKAVCQTAKEMQHPELSRFEQELQQKQPVVQEIQVRAEKTRKEKEQLDKERAEQKRKEEREKAERERKRQAELKSKQVANAKAKAEATAPKWYTTGGKMLYGTKDGLLFGVDVQYFYSKAGHYYGYKDITIWVSVQNTSKSPQLLRPYSLQILDEQGAAYAPAVAKVLEGSNTVHCIATTLNPNMQVDFQLQYEVPKKSKFYFPILGRNGDAFVIEKQDWEEKPIPKFP
jgi:predicted Holliday junction resolvase-like endonuclease